MCLREITVADAMKSSPEHAKIGMALVAALQPLVDVCLATGVTSPEFESLLRVAFVLRAFDKLPRHETSGRGPTANQVAVACGVNWEDVARIRDSGGLVAAQELMQARERSSSKVGRVVQGWTTDPRFMTSGGSPLNLPIRRNRERRSFADLVAKYAPSTHPGTLLKQMTRRGQVDILEDEIVRFRRSTERQGGLTPAAIAAATKHVKQLAETLFANLGDPNSPMHQEDTDTLRVSAEEFARIRPTLEKRFDAFVRSLKTEYPKRAGEVKDEVRFRVSVYSARDE